jgi:DNA-binding winged helix-turn-helix (wHTH) protein
VLDTGARELFVGGQPRHLTLKQFQLLELLVEQRPRALSKAELHHRLWPGVFVSESALSSLVAELRQAIDDHARESGTLIRTVHGHGYAFSGQVSAVPEPAAAGALAFRLIWDDREIALVEGENILGRMREAIVWIDDPRVSRQHAVIHTTPAGATLFDLGSKNGTLVNDHRVVGQQVLKDGDSIAIGDATFVFREYAADAPTVTSTRRGT